MPIEVVLILSCSSASCTCSLYAHHCIAVMITLKWSFLSWMLIEGGSVCLQNAYHCVAIIIPDGFSLLLLEVVTDAVVLCLSRVARSAFKMR